MSRGLSAAAFRVWIALHGKHAGAETMRRPESQLTNGRLIAGINLRAAALD